MIGEETETDREYKIKIERDETTQAYELVRRGYQSQLLSRDEIVQATQATITAKNSLNIKGCY